MQSAETSVRDNQKIFIPALKALVASDPLVPWAFGGPKQVNLAMHARESDTESNYNRLTLLYWLQKSEW